MTSSLGIESRTKSRTQSTTESRTESENHSHPEVEMEVEREYVTGSSSGSGTDREREIGEGSGEVQLSARQGATGSAKTLRPKASAIMVEHIHRPPDRPHRVVIRPDLTLRCLDCQRTLIVAAVPSSTSTSKGLPHATESCSRHPGEWPTTCGRCRSEQLERRADEHGTPQPTADVHTRAAEVRATLPSATPTPRRDRDLDTERMAQARTELAARETVPMPTAGGLPGASL